MPCPPLVDPGVIGPVGIHGRPVFRQRAENRKGRLAAHSEEINPQPQIRIGTSAVLNNGQKPVHLKIVVNQKGAGRAALDNPGKIPPRLASI